MDRQVATKGKPFNTTLCRKAWPAIISSRFALGVVFSLLIPFQMAHAGTYTTVQAGNWNSSSTWQGGSKPVFSGKAELGGHTVNINHRVNYDIGDDLYVQSGTLNVSDVLKIDNKNIKMEDSSGEVNIDEGLIIIGNDNFDLINGTVNFSKGAVQLCNGNYTNESSADTNGDGYIYSKNGSVLDKTSGNFSSNIDWCADNTSDTPPAAENCGVAEPPSGDCENETHYLTLNSSNNTWNTPISLYATHAGKMDYTVIGNSELEENGGSYNCKLSDSSTATLSLPTDAKVEAAYLYWYAMEENDTSDNIAYNALNDTVSVTFNGTPQTISSSRSFDSAIWFSNGPITYGARFADVTSLLSPSPNGSYTVDVTGGASESACPLRKENARGWALMVVYEDPARTSANRIYVYDGMVGFVYSNTTVSVAVDGYHVPALRTEGSMTAISIQGDPGISGEWLTTSDTSFPDFGSDFANSTSGGALDIDLLTGDFTADSTTMTLNASSSGDVILLTNIALAVPSEMDFGDAPASYGDPVHTIPDTPTLYLGTTQPDDDVDSQPSDTADWDDNDGTVDEDGVTVPTTDWTPNQTETLPVAIQGSGVLNAWIDWNQDGDFDETNEQIANEQSVTTGTTDLSVAVPDNVTSGDIVARFRLCSTAGDCNTPAGFSDDGEVEDHLIPVDDCTGLTGDVSQVAPAIPLQISSGDKIFTGSSSLSPTEGHLKAFLVEADGSIASAASWDAATLMDATERQASLYSTDSSSTKILFNNLNDAAFAAGASPDATKIKEFTLDPSVDSGAYLGDRKDGSFLGTMGRGNDVELVTQDINIPLFLEDATYRSFYSGTVAPRSEKVLATSDDGFLYAFDQSDGDLAWGWLPRSVAEELQNYTSFQDNQFMRGKVDVLDVKHSGSYGTYVVGGYKNGLGHYVLKLNASGGLDSIIWDEDRSGSFITAPNHGEMGYFRDSSGTTYMAYVVTKSSNVSTLVIRSIPDASVKREVALNFNATSTPFIMPDFDDSNGPAAKTLYLGDDSGNIRRTALLASGSLDTAANLKSALEASTVGELGSAESILFLGASISASDRKYYLRAQSESRLTVLKYNTSSTNWDKHWTSYVGGAGTWDSLGTFTADTSGAPTDNDGDGIATDVSTNGIQSLPANARITDAAQIVADAIVVPVSVQSSTYTCINEAFYYLYRLTDGKFADNKLFGVDGAEIEEDIFVGYGDPSRIVISDYANKGKMTGHGNSDQSPSNTTGVTSFVINDNVSTGIRGWKEIGR